MKYEPMTCGRCNGNGKIIKRGIQLELKDSDFEDCPNCDGTGELVCISPKQWKEYQWLEKIADELEAKHIEVADLKKN